MSPIFLFKRFSMPKTQKSWLTLIFASIFGSTLNLGLLFLGTKYTSVTEQAIITAVAPIFVIIGGAFFLKERVTKKEKIGIGITLLGTLILTLQPIFETHGDGFTSVFGNTMLVLSNLAWVGYVILTKKNLREKVDAVSITYIGFVVGFITTLPIAFLENGSFSKMLEIITLASPKAQAGVVYMAVISGAIGYYLFQLGHKTIEVSEAALFSYLQAIFTIPFAVVLLNEKLTLPFIIGAGVVVVGVLFAELKTASRK